MKTPQQEIVIFVSTLVAFSQFCGCVLTGYETQVQDITLLRKFGCRWTGGSSITLVCNCTDEADEMFIQRNSIPTFDTTGIEINGCKSVRFGQYSIDDMKNLRRIWLSDIGSIIFDENSLNWYGNRHDTYERFDLGIPALRIFVRNSYITKIATQTFSGRINEINFDGVIVENIDPFAFSGLLQTEKIIISNSELKNVVQQPFKKFGTEMLELNGVKANLLPSRTFSDVTVYKSFIISNCSFDTVRPGAFSINNPESFQVTDTKINQLDGEAFKITTRGDVLFRNNIFFSVNGAAFEGIRLNRNEVFSDRTMTFDTNTFTVLSRDSLSVKDFNTKFINFNINATCKCHEIDSSLKESDFFSEIRCLYEDEYVTVREYKSDMCSIISSYFTTIVIVCVIIGLLGIISIGLFVYYKMIYKSKKYGSEKSSKKPGPLSLIVPDGRTYRETELHVIVERNDLLTTDL